MNLTGIYIFSGFMILFAIFQFINLLNKASKDGKTQLLDEMFDNSDITSDVYAKYKKEL